MKVNYFLQPNSRFKHIMNVITILLLLVCFTSTLTSQNIQIHYGNTFSKSKEKTFNSNFDNEYSNHGPLVIVKVNKLYCFKNIDFSYRFQYHDIWTNLRVDDSPNNFFGYGTSSITVVRNSIVLGYDVLQNSKRFSIIPTLNLSVDRFINRGFIKEEGVKKHYRTMEIFDKPGTKNQDFIGIIYKEVYDGWAFLPGLGMEVEWNFLWRFILSFDLNYSFGTKDYQNFYFDHSYQGGPREELKFTADGSLFSASVGLGFKLWDHKNSK